MTVADLHMLTGAYALHALDPAERDAFEAHLAVCESCAEEVREFAATTERLGLSVAEAPPPELRERVLRGIRTVRQEPPLVHRPVAPEAGAGAVRRLPRAYRFALAACVALAAALGGVAVWQHQSAQAERRTADRADARSAEIAAVLTASDAHATSGTVRGGASATVVESASVGRAVMLTSGLPALPGGRTYQLWYDDSGTMRPAGFVTPAAAHQTVLLKGGLDGAEGMGITVEPAGGSPHPTSTPVALMLFQRS